MSGVESLPGFSGLGSMNPVYSSFPDSKQTKTPDLGDPPSAFTLSPSSPPLEGFRSSYPLSSRHKAAWGLGGVSIGLGTAAVGCLAGGATLYTTATAESIFLFPFLLDRDFRNAVVGQTRMGDQLFVAGGVLGAAALGTAIAALVVRFGK